MHVQPQVKPFKHTGGKHSLRPPSPSPLEDTVTFPFNELPPEIMSEIFLRCFSYTGTHFVHGRRSSPPYVLSQVSRPWRKIALSTPALWSSLSIVYDRSVLLPHISLIELWMSRSGSVPLSFSIKIDLLDSEHSPVQSMELVKRALGLYILEVERWKNVQLVLPHTLDPDMWHIPITGALILKTLNIRVVSVVAYPPPLLDLIYNSPHLHSLNLVLPTMPAVVDQAWRTLSKLHLKTCMSIFECISVLEACQVLESCFFEDISTHVSLDAQSLPRMEGLKHERLHSLRIESRTNVSPLIQLLTLPSLAYLMLEIVGEEGRNEQWTPTVMSTFILRSKPPLRRLTLENVPVAEREIIDCLYALPSLLVLNINDEGVPLVRLTSSLILKLGGHDTNYPTTPLMCPKLEVIRLHGRVLSSDGDFADMVQVRQSAAAASDNAEVARLRVIHVEFCAGPHNLDIECVNRWRRQGLTAHVFVR